MRRFKTQYRRAAASAEAVYIWQDIGDKLEDMVGWYESAIEPLRKSDAMDEGTEDVEAASDNLDELIALVGEVTDAMGMLIDELEYDDYEDEDEYYPLPHDKWLSPGAGPRVSRFRRAGANDAWHLISGVEAEIRDPQALYPQIMEMLKKDRTEEAIEAVSSLMNELDTTVLPALEEALDELDELGGSRSGW